jgi:hypothetical protein
MKLKLKAFRAIDHLELCMAYQHGHLSILTNLGIKDLNTAREEWMHNPDMYVSLIFLNESVVAGSRLQIKNATTPLPIELAVEYMDSRILKEVANRSEAKTGEACGLWIGDEVRNMKMGLVLTRCVVILAKLLQLKSVFVLTSQFSIKMTKQCGFVPLTTLGEDGTFMYPTVDYTSTVSINDDIVNLSSTEIEQRVVIDYLASNRMAQLIEATDKGNVIIEYNFLEVQS